MRRFLIVLGLFVIFLLVALIFTTAKEGGHSLKISKVKIGLAVFDVEVADNVLLRAKGLSERESLGENKGILFIFPEPSIQKFWMKDIRFPLDIVWIANNQVVGIIYGVEPESGESPTIYTSPQPVDKVLEVNAGEISKFGIKINDTVELK